MKVFYLTLFSTYILAFFSRLKLQWDKYKKPTLIFTLVILIILVGVSGLRRSMGDTGDYKHLYGLIVIGQDMSDSGYEQGFIKFLQLLAKISPNPQTMVFVTALITTVLFILVLREYHSYFELEIFMYIASGYYLVTMNGIRQAMAAAFLFVGTKFIVDGKFIPYLMVVLFASTFHTSALIMIPVYFIVRQEAWSQKIMLVIFISIVVLIFIQPLMDILFKSLEGTKLSGYEESVIGGAEGGANAIRAVVEAVPIVIAYIYREKLKEIWPESNIFVNMCLINLILMCFALYNWLFARFNMYFQPYTYILLPYLIKNIFQKKEQRLIYYLFILCYFGFFYYEHVISLGIIYSSDFINI